MFSWALLEVPGLFTAVWWLLPKWCTVKHQYYNWDLWNNACSITTWLLWRYFHLPKYKIKTGQRLSLDDPVQTSLFCMWPLDLLQIYDVDSSMSEVMYPEPCNSRAIQRADIPCANPKWSMIATASVGPSVLLHLTLLASRETPGCTLSFQLAKGGDAEPCNMDAPDNNHPDIHN